MRSKIAVRRELCGELVHYAAVIPDCTGAGVSRAARLRSGRSNKAESSLPAVPVDCLPQSRQSLAFG
jgi:hypothetical protein